MTNLYMLKKDKDNAKHVMGVANSGSGRFARQLSTDWPSAL